MTDPTDLISEEQRGADSAAKLAKQEAQDKADFRKLLSTEFGRRFVWRMLGEAGVFHTAFNPNAMQMARNEGRRAWGLFWLDVLMNTAPEKFVQMQQENAK